MKLLIIGLVIGYLIGNFVGILFTCLMVASGRDSREREVEENRIDLIEEKIPL